jgi:hypothetical protein
MDKETWPDGKTDNRPTCEPSDRHCLLYITEYAHRNKIMFFHQFGGRSVEALADMSQTELIPAAM